MSQHKLPVPQCGTRPRSSRFARREGLILLIALIGPFVGASAQSIPPDRDGLEQGEGLGMALPAELSEIAQTRWII